jgi:hypothetical protein
MRYAVWVAAVVLLGLLVGFLFPRRFGPDTAATRLEVTVLRLSGTPREQGRTHGVELRHEIRAWIERVRPKDPALAKFAIEACGEKLWEHIPTDIREEMEGVAEGAGVTRLEILYLHSRFELQQFDLGGVGGGRFRGACAAGPQRTVVKWFEPSDLGGEFSDLILVVREGPTPSVLVALPGMVGGFLAARPGCAVTIRPMETVGDPALNATTWPVFLRGLLAVPPLPDRDAARVTIVASFPLTASGLGVGTLLTGENHTWHAGKDGYAGPVDPAAAHARPPRATLVETPPEGGLAVSLRVASDSVTVTFDGVGGRRTARIPLKRSEERQRK